MDQWVNYQIQLSNAYSMFHQENQKICSQSIYHKLLAVKYGLENGIYIDLKIIDEITQDNIHQKLIYQNYLNQEHPQGYDQNFHDSLLQELLQAKFVLRQAQHIDRHVTKEEFKELKESITRSIKYRQVNHPNSIDDEISGYFLWLDYYSGIVLHKEQSGPFYESFEELFKTLDIVDKLKKLIKQEDSKYSDLIDYESRVCGHLQRYYQLRNLPRYLQLLERQMKILENLNLQYGLEYIQQYKIYCNHNPIKYELINKTLKLHQQFEKLDDKFKNRAYQNITILLFKQQVMQNQTKLVDEIKKIIENDSSFDAYWDFQVFPIVNQFIDSFKEQKELKKNIKESQDLIILFLRTLFIFTPNNELLKMSEQIIIASPDSKELNIMIFLLNSLFSETNQYYPYIAKDQKIWNYLISLFNLCFQDMNANNQIIIETTQTSSNIALVMFINMIYTQLKLMKYLELRHPFNEIKAFIIKEGPQHQLKIKLNDLSIE